MAKILGAIALKTTTGALDQIDGINLLDGDAALVVTNTNFYFYKLSDNDATTERVPYVIKPAFNGVNKRWHLLKMDGVSGAFSVDELLTGSINFPGNSFEIKSGSSTLAVFDKTTNSLSVNKLSVTGNGLSQGLNAEFINGKPESELILRDGSRPFSNPVTAPSATSGVHLVNKNYVDTLFSTVSTSTSATDFYVHNDLNVNNVTSFSGADLNFKNNDDLIMTINPTGVSMSQLISVDSSNMVNNLNAQYLNGHSYTDIDNEINSLNASNLSFEPSGSASLVATNIQDALYELDSEKQAVLVSGTNIKTIDGSSVIGSGNLLVRDTTAITGLLKGNGSIISAAVAGVDYALPSPPWTTLAVSGAATASTNYFANTSSGAFSILLPAAPAAGDAIRICDLAGTFDLNNLTVKRNGKLIMGLAEDLTLNVKNASITLVFSGDTYGWKLV